MILHADIEADATLNVLPHNQDSSYPIMDAYNAIAVPDFWAWKTDLGPSEYGGTGGIVWEEVNLLTAGKARIFEWMTGGFTRSLNPADSNQRQGILNAFASGSETRANLIALGRRRATRLERLFAMGTGTTASPATMVVEGGLSSSDADYAWAFWE
jgi:hypothetical protein